MLVQESEAYANEVKTYETHLWHIKLGHRSQMRLHLLVNRGLLDKGKVSFLEFCEDYILGKAHKLKFLMRQHTSENVVDYIHTDIWGPSYVPKSLGKCQHFISIIDYHSRKVWVSFLNSKYEAFAKFNEKRIMVENQTDRKIKKLRTYNGLELCNYQFDVICKENGIIRHKDNDVHTTT